MVTAILVLLLCFRPADRVMCPNHEVVVFQPWTWTDPYVGSVANYTFYSYPPAPPDSTNFLYLFIVPLCPIFLPSFVFLLISPLSSTRYPPTLSSRITFHLNIERTRHPPASADRLSTQHHVSICAVLYYDCAL